MLSGSGMHASLIPVTETWTMLRAERRSKVLGSICTRLMKSSAQRIAWGTPDRARSRSSNRFPASNLDDDCSSREVRIRRAAEQPCRQRPLSWLSNYGKGDHSTSCSDPDVDTGVVPVEPHYGRDQRGQP